MLEISGKTNLLEQNAYKYSLQDVAEPNLQRDIYTQGAVPKVPFNHRRVPMNMPEEIWITDTSLRDGQQSVEPYTVDQIVNIYKYLSRLGGPYGIIRQTEFFIYSKKDREALEKCMELGLKFPEITTWIRATKEDFRLVRDLGIRADFADAAPDEHDLPRAQTARVKGQPLHGLPCGLRERRDERGKLGIHGADHADPAIRHGNHSFRKRGRGRAVFCPP